MEEGDHPTVPLTPAPWRKAQKEDAKAEKKKDERDIGWEKRLLLGIVFGVQIVYFGFLLGTGGRVEVGEQCGVVMLCGVLRVVE